MQLLDGLQSELCCSNYRRDYMFTCRKQYLFITLIYIDLSNLYPFIRLCPFIGFYPLIRLCPFIRLLSAYHIMSIYQIVIRLSDYVHLLSTAVYFSPVWPV